MKKYLLLTGLVSILLPLIVLGSGRQERNRHTERKMAELLTYDAELLQMALKIKMVEQYKGSVIISYDSIREESKFIGRITNEFDADSIFNELGRYGSNLSSTSIWNDLGRYGSTVSSLSAFNELASNPPFIVNDGRTIGRLTVNKTIPGGINPHVLRWFFIN